MTQVDALGVKPTLGYLSPACCNLHGGSGHGTVAERGLFVGR